MNKITLIKFRMDPIQSLTEMFIKNINELRDLYEKKINATDAERHNASNNYHAALNFHNSYFTILITSNTVELLRSIAPLWASEMIRPYRMARAEILRDLHRRRIPVDMCLKITEYLRFSQIMEDSRVVGNAVETHLDVPSKASV